MTTRKFQIKKINFLQMLPSILLWIALASLIGVAAGSASAGFLFSLDLVTATRTKAPWLLFFLPIAGIAIAYLYSRHGKGTEAGNNLIIDEIHNPKKVIPLRMTPLVLFSTLVTHLFGGSAGREGTAVQMGASLADQLTPLLKFDDTKRKILMMAGISAGFSAVFGTPLAGAVFGLEVLSVGRIRYAALLPCFIAAVIADQVCLAWGIHHTTYTITTMAPMTLVNILWCLIAGVCFGLCALLFSWSTHHFTKVFKNTVANPLWRPFLGGIIIIIMVMILQTDRYLGLGVPVIVESFNTTLPPYDFLLKILFTVITLSSGFKGGEVTPLFFIGATLGNALAWLLPLPASLLAGMGFVAVFAGAANTPLACTLMALELFGTGSATFTALACVMSYLFSGHKGIYHSQTIEVHKHA
ncbi:MAG: voltage-gated chloride channel family protein [Bdellovibrio sp.]